MANPRRRTARVGARGAKPGVARAQAPGVQIALAEADRVVVLAED